MYTVSVKKLPDTKPRAMFVKYRVDWMFAYFTVEGMA
jgi:hypothetical protein